MRSFLILVFQFSIWLSQSAMAGAIFGNDDRALIFPSSILSTAARSTAISALSSHAEDVGVDQFNLLVDDLKDYLCPNQRFRSEPSLQYACTGFLVAPNLIATAGHCMVNTGETINQEQMYCKAYSWLFDYQKTASGRVLTQGISKDKLYRCKKIIYAVRDERAPFRDFALVELDRPVLDRKPLQLDSSIIPNNARLTMIGYPMGMPAQAVTNSNLLLNDPKRESFITNLDAIEGNSGSPVFNSRGKVIGILVGGTPTQSFVDQPRLNCAVMNRCSSLGKACTAPESDTSIFPGFQRIGAEVQRIAPILELIN